MGGFGDAIKYLYDKFILRDVLSFVTPGGIVVLTATYLFFPEILCRHIPWPFYILFFAVFYMVGFAVQCLGEISGRIRIHRIAGSNLCQRLRILLQRNWACDQNIWWIQAHADVVAFHEYANENRHRDEREWARLQQERLVVLKQMCANSFLAIIIAGIFLAVNYCPWTPAKISVVSIVAFLLLVSLFWGYCAHELRLDTMSRAIQHLPPR